MFTNLQKKPTRKSHHFHMMQHDITCNRTDLLNINRMWYNIQTPYKDVIQYPPRPGLLCHSNTQTCSCELNCNGPKYTWALGVRRTEESFRNMNTYRTHREPTQTSWHDKVRPYKIQTSTETRRYTKANPPSQGNWGEEMAQPTNAEPNYESRTHMLAPWTLYTRTHKRGHILSLQIILINGVSWIHLIVQLVLPIKLVCCKYNCVRVSVIAGWPYHCGQAMWAMTLRTGGERGGYKQGRELIVVGLGKGGNDCEGYLGKLPRKWTHETCW